MGAAVRLDDVQHHIGGRVAAAAGVEAEVGLVEIAGRGEVGKQFSKTRGVFPNAR